MEPYRILIVDDEQIARARIRHLLAGCTDCVIVAEAGNGEEAAAAIVAHHPDIVFLDIQMPVLDGFGVIDRVGIEGMPVVVFVTAFDHYAIRGFQVNALDYLLKPFDDDRFEASLQRARTMVDQRRLGAAAQRLAGLLAHMKPGPRTENASAADDEPNALEPGTDRLDRIVVKTGDRVRIIPTASIDWIEATGNYVRLHVGAETHVLRSTLQEIETRLDPQQFVRIHRSTIVAIDRVRELREYYRGEYIVLLHDGAKLKLSRGRRAHLEQLLGQSF